MLGQLPTTLQINGKKYEIRTDYRNVLRIFEAFADKELTDKEKMIITHADEERKPRYGN